jgi:hypothetical protein
VVSLHPSLGLGRTGGDDPNANVSTTATYYIKTVPAQVTDAMEKLQQSTAGNLIWQQSDN